MKRILVVLLGIILPVIFLGCIQTQASTPKALFPMAKILPPLLLSITVELTPVYLYSLEPVDQGNSDKGNFLGVKYENGNERRFNTQEWKIIVFEVINGKFKFYSDYINHWEGPDPIGRWGLAYIDGDKLYIWLESNPLPQIPRPTTTTYQKT